MSCLRMEFAFSISSCLGEGQQVGGRLVLQLLEGHAGQAHGGDAAEASDGLVVLGFGLGLGGGGVFGLGGGGFDLGVSTVSVSSVSRRGLRGVFSALDFT